MEITQKENTYSKAKLKKFKNETEILQNVFKDLLTKNGSLERCCEDQEEDVLTKEGAMNSIKNSSNQNAREKIENITKKIEKIKTQNQMLISDSEKLKIGK